jgi:hypothetical protein
VEHFSDASFLDKLPKLPANVRLGLKGIARYKHSSIFALDVSDKEKKFYNINPWCRYYKTLFFIANEEAKLPRYLSQARLSSLV